MKDIEQHKIVAKYILYGSVDMADFHNYLFYKGLVKILFKVSCIRCEL